MKTGHDACFPDFLPYFCIERKLYAIAPPPVVAPDSWSAESNILMIKSVKGEFEATMAYILQKQKCSIDKSLISLAEDQSSPLSTHMWQFTTTCNSRS